MHFIELNFVSFMTIVFVLYWGANVVTMPWLRGVVGTVGGWLGRPADQIDQWLPDTPRILQNVLLVVCSAVFYGWVTPWWLLLLYFSAVLDYFVGRGILQRPEHKQRLLILSLMGNLGMLGVFKYYNFFVWNVAEVLSALGFQANMPTLQVILPVGISFYTFQTMSYTIDVYRGRLQPRRNFLDYVVYVSFFPQLVAGPIERAASLLPQVERRRTFDLDRTISGISLALWGGFKKICIADTLAPYVNEVFMTREPAFIMVLAAGFAFGVQMLADFSGYTDIARGTARTLGFDLVENFERPYSALSTPEFWRKWHISLSSWVGDYVYTPLLRTGRPSPMRTMGAIMVTFFLIGLWHGASWNFIVLGVYNGFWMVFYTFMIPMIPRSLRGQYGKGPLRTALQLVLDFGAWLFHTLVVLQVTGLLFREVSLSRVRQHLSQPWFAATEEELVAAGIVAAMAIVGTLPINLSWFVEDRILPRLSASSWFLPVQTTFWAFEIVAMFVFYRDASGDFIYFQF